MRRSNIIYLSLALAFSSLVLNTSGQETSSNYTERVPDSGTSTTATSATPTSNQALPTTPDDQEFTSTVDSLGVNLDETGINSTVINDDDSSNTGPTDDFAGPGIEAKSISSADEGGNALQGEQNGKLVSIESSDGGAEPDSSSALGKGYSTNRLSSRINMTEVDHLYDSETHKDEQQTVEAWHSIEEKLKKGIKNIVGAVVPWALNMTQEAKISGNCSGAMLKWVLGMTHLKAWAIKMLDATGKPVAGMLEGSMTLFGNYRECLNVRAPDDDETEYAGEFKEHFRGKYCIIQAKPRLPKKDRFYSLNTKLRALVEGAEENPWYEKTTFDELNEWLLGFNFLNLRVDLCIPSLCSREDIQKVLRFLFKGIDMKARVARCEMEALEGSSHAASVETSSHQLTEALTALPSTGSASITYSLNKDFLTRVYWVAVPAIAMAIVLAATALSMAMGSKLGKKNKFNYALRSLSLKRSIDSHLGVDYDQLADDKPLALYGIRWILVLWVILVESAVNLKFEYLRELLMLKDLIFWWPMQIIINSTLQFDSIILMTAFTMAYKNCLRYNDNNAKSLTKFIIDKYIRLMPSIMVLVALVILLPFIYRGPVWNDYVTQQSAVCQSTGWLNTVFLQNYLPYKEIVSIRTIC